MHLFVIYILVFIVQIVLQVMAIRKQSKKTWVTLLILEPVSMLVAICLQEYYDSLPGYGFLPGFSYLGEIMFSFFASVVYGVSFLISASIFIIQAERRKKLMPLYAVACFLLAVAGAGYLGHEIISNSNKTECTGTVVGFEDVHTGNGIEQWPLIEFTVDGKQYRDDYPIFDGAVIGQELTVYFYPQGDNYKCVLYKENLKYIYIPAFLLSGICFLLRRKKQVTAHNSEN